MGFLVTGGAGFIGSHLVEQLVRAGNPVRVLDDFSTGNRENLARAAGEGPVELVEGTVCDPDTVAKAARGTAGIFHLAAMSSVSRSVANPLESFENNARGTLNVLEAARREGVARVVLASSSAVYGDGKGGARNESETPAPISPYGLDKVYLEQVGALYHQQFGLQTTALRYFNVYGPRQDPLSPYAGVIPLFMGRARQGKALPVFGDGEQSRDFIFVDDLIWATLRVAEVPYRGFRIYNVGAGTRVTINELARLVREVVGVQVPLVHQAAREGDVGHSLADISALREATGFQPQWPLRRGLEALAASLEPPEAVSR